MASVSTIKYSIPMLVLLLTSANMGPLISPGMQQTAKSENSTISKAVMKKETAQVAANHARGGSSSPDVMIVDPKEVAKDWTSAFTMLKNKQTGNIVFHLSGGEMIHSIVDVQSLPGGYLMFFTLKNLHGLQYKIIKTSEISSISS